MAIYDPPPVSGPLPERVEPLRMIKRKATLVGTVALGRMPRLQGALASDVGHVEAALRFGMDETRIPALRGAISGHAELECQRCLAPVTWHFELAFCLGLVESEAQAVRLPEGYEPLVLEEHTLTLAPIVEDELILALPIVPRHAEGEPCEWQRRWDGQDRNEQEKPGSDADKVRRDNPFQALAALKSGSDNTDR